ncbi:MAG: carbohydrate ABC transporter permease [Caldilineae bacterium]|nr:MAG: carbohydrate ABC transporter permease [Caldilineae bacterium]
MKGARQLRGGQVMGRVARGVRDLVAWLASLALLYPVLWLLAGALWPDQRPLSDWLMGGSAFRPNVANFAVVAETIPLTGFVLSSLRVVFFAVPLAVLVASWAAFAMSRLQPGVRRWLVALSLAGMLVPSTALWLARFPLFRLLGWLDTPLALIAPALIGGSPFFVLLLYTGYRRLPEEMLEAAALDGASPGAAWRLVALPNVAATTGAVALLNFLFFWSNFTDPLLYVRSVSQMTLPVGVRLLAQMDESRWPLLMAGSLVLALPPSLAFLLGQGLLRELTVNLRGG